MVGGSRWCDVLTAVRRKNTESGYVTPSKLVDENTNTRKPVAVATGFLVL